MNNIMNKKIILIIFAIVLISAGAYYWYFYRQMSIQSPPSVLPNVKAPEEIPAKGQINFETEIRSSVVGDWPTIGKVEVLLVALDEAKEIIEGPTGCIGPQEGLHAKYRGSYKFVFRKLGEAIPFQIMELSVMEFVAGSPHDGRIHLTKIADSPYQQFILFQPDGCGGEFIYIFGYDEKKKEFVQSHFLRPRGLEGKTYVENVVLSRLANYANPSVELNEEGLLITKIYNNADGKIYTTTWRFNPQVLSGGGFEIVSQIAQ